MVQEVVKEIVAPPPVVRPTPAPEIVETIAPAPIMAGPVAYSAPVVETIAPSYGGGYGAPMVETIAAAPIMSAPVGYGAPVVETIAPSYGAGYGAGYGVGTVAATPVVGTTYGTAGARIL